MKNSTPRQSWKVTLAAVSGAALAFSAVAYAGTLTAPSGTPAATGYTLGDVYAKLADFSASATEGGHDLSTTTAPAASSPSIADIYGLLAAADATLLPENIADGVDVFGVTGTLVAGGGLPATGQTHCNAAADNYGSFSQVPCAGTGQDGESQRGAAHGYVDNSDGTVTDGATNLTWQQCAAGLSGAGCVDGSASTFTFDDGNGESPAIDYCQSLDLGGHTDWELPNVRELSSIVDYGRANPAIDTDFFPNTPSDVFWSSTADEGGAYGAWIVNFGDGGAYYDGVSYGSGVRCVRQNS